MSHSNNNMLSSRQVGVRLSPTPANSFADQPDTNRFSVYTSNNNTRVSSLIPPVSRYPPNNVKRSPNVSITASSSSSSTPDVVYKMNQEVFGFFRHTELGQEEYWVNRTNAKVPSVLTKEQIMQDSSLCDEFASFLHLNNTNNNTNGCSNGSQLFQQMPRVEPPLPVFTRDYTHEFVRPSLTQSAFDTWLSLNYNKNNNNNNSKEEVHVR